MSTDMWQDEAPAENGFAARPRDLEAERIVVGSVMQQPDLIDELAEEFTPDDFSEPIHAWVWKAVDHIRMELGDGPVRWHAVEQQLRAWWADKTMPIAPMSGPHLSELQYEAQPGSADYYAFEVTKKAIANRLVEHGLRAQQIGMSPAFDQTADLAAMQTQLDAVAREDTGASMVRAGSLIDDALERAVTPPEHGERVPTGFTDVDSLTGGGFAGGWLVVVGARPGDGKTTIGTGFARAAAIDANVPAAIFALEMGRNEVMSLVLSAEARVPLHHIKNGTVTPDDVERLARRREAIANAPLYIDDSVSVNVASIRAHVRRLVRTVGLRLVVIDYLQLMQSSRSGRQENREREVAEISRALKLMAKEFNIVVVLLAQLNRGPEQRQDKKPTKSDLRESGAIEQDADICLLLHRPDAHEPESPRAGEIDLIFDKFRHGPRCTITAAAQMHYARLVDMAQT